MAKYRLTFWCSGSFSPISLSGSFAYFEVRRAEILEFICVVETVLMNVDCLPPVVNNEESICLFAGMVLSREISMSSVFFGGDLQNELDHPGEQCPYPYLRAIY